MTRHCFETTSELAVSFYIFVFFISIFCVLTLFFLWIQWLSAVLSCPTSILSPIPNISCRLQGSTNIPKHTQVTEHGYMVDKGKVTNRLARGSIVLRYVEFSRRHFVADSRYMISVTRFHKNTEQYPSHETRFFGRLRKSYKPFYAV